MVDSDWQVVEAVDVEQQLERRVDPRRRRIGRRHGAGPLAGPHHPPLPRRLETKSDRVTYTEEANQQKLHQNHSTTMMERRRID